MTTTAIATISDQAVISSYNRGPILTAFTAPTSCTATPTFGEGMYVGHWGSGYLDPACYPSSTDAANAAPSLWDIYYYSPAICPYAWSTVTTWTSAYGGADTTNVLSIGPETTVAVCCPQSYTYDNDYHRCYTEFASKNSVFLYIDPTTDAKGNWYPAATSETTVDSATYSIYADGVPVWHQSSDLALFAAATQTSTTSASPSTSSGSTPTSSGNMPTSSANMPTGSENTPATSTTAASATPTPSLSNGVKIGIGIGIPVIAIAAVAAVACFCLTKRKQARQVIPQKQQEEGQFAAGVGGYFSLKQELPVPIPVQPMAELSTQRPPVELQSRDPVRYKHISDKESGQQVVFELQ